MKNLLLTFMAIVLTTLGSTATAGDVFPNTKYEMMKRESGWSSNFFCNSQPEMIAVLDNLQMFVFLWHNYKTTPPGCAITSQPVHVGMPEIISLYIADDGTFYGLFSIEVEDTKLWSYAMEQVLVEKQPDGEPT